MKTITLIAVALFFSINVFSQEKESYKILGTEKTVFSKTTAGYDIKKVYQYDNEGLLKERVFYIYYENYWLPLQKHTIQYDLDQRVKNIFLVKWNKSESKWRDEVYLQTSYYDDQGTCHVVHTRESSNTMKKLLAVKQD